MKISELQHRDPAWAYIELNDGSLVAMPKKVTEELREETERLKSIIGDEEYMQGLKGLADNNLKLREENERLKKELERVEGNNELQCKSLEAHSELITKFRKENERLKCLALHAMSQYYGYKSLFSSRKKTHRIKYGQFSNKFYEAYRKAKKELREGK